MTLKTMAYDAPSVDSYSVRRIGDIFTPTIPRKHSPSAIPRGAGEEAALSGRGGKNR